MATKQEMRGFIMNNVFKKALSLILSIVVCIGAIFAPISNAFAEVGGVPSIYNASKTVDDANWESWLADVTLTLSGESVSEGTAIVYVMGGFVSKDETLLLALVDAFEAVLATQESAYIRFGIVPFSETSEAVLPMTTLEAGKVQEVLEKALDEASVVYGGVNLHGALLTARDMLKGETDIPAERKHVVCVSTGNTYTFNNDDGEVSTVVAENSAGDILWGDILWRRMRSAHSTSTYTIPKAYNDSFSAYWADLVNDIAADGNKYVYTPSGQDEPGWYSKWTNANTNEKSPKNGRVIVSPAVKAEEFGEGVIQGVPFAYSTSETGADHAINYERAQYESWVVWNEMQLQPGEKFSHVLRPDEEIEGLGYNCYSIYISMYADLRFDNGAEQSGGRNSIGHGFMDFLAGGEGKAVKYRSAENKAFFSSIIESILGSLSSGSRVEDYVGYSDDPVEGYDFDFITDASTIKVIVGGEEYIATELETPVEGATKSYTFKDGAYTLDYYRGNGKDEERFIWNINETVLTTAPASLVYSLDLVGKSTYPGTHEVFTSQHTDVKDTTLYPVNTDGVDGVPEVLEDTPLYYVVPDPKTDITIKKVDENGNPLAGAKFELFAVNGEEKTSLGEYAVDQNGELVFEELVAGTYELVETVAPAGYVGVEEPMSFEIVKTAEGFKVRNLLGEYVLHFPYTAYEISNHSFYPAIPQTFVLLEADKAADWTYSEEYVFGESDYHVVYCADSSAICEDGVTYIKYLVEDVFGAEAAGKLRAIIEKSYPYVSLEDMIDAMVEAGVADAENLTRGDVIAAIQLAVWHFSNGGGYTYRATYSVMDHPEWGLVYNDYTDELPEGLPVNTKGSWKDEASIARIDAMFEYLINLDPVEATDGEVGVYCYLATSGSEHEVLIGAERSDIDYYTNGTEIIVKNYAKNPATVVIDGNKLLDGEIPADKQFSFELWFEEKCIGTVANDAEGYFAFADIIFDAEGTYVYTVKEVIGDDAKIVYDESIYTVTVVVTLDGTDYVADVTITLGEDECDVIEFYNATKEDIPEEEPPLGSTAETVWTIFLVIAMLGIVMTSMKKRAIQ